MNTFAQRLRHAMNMAEMKQSELAEKSGAPRSAISQYLSGCNVPGPERIQALANATGCSAAFLTGEETPPEETQPPPGWPGKITVAMAARCLRTSDQAVRINMQRGRLPIGRALQGSGNRFIYVIVPEKLREEAGEARFNEFFGLTARPPG